jgi:hypothetical protein
MKLSRTHIFKRFVGAILILTHASLGWSAPFFGRSAQDVFNSSARNFSQFNGDPNFGGFNGTGEFRSNSAFNSAFNNGFNSRSFGSGNRFEFFNDAKEIAGFSRLLQRGNQLLGQTSAGDHIRLFIDGRGNLVDRTGRRVSNRDPRIVREAQDFFLTNRNKFQGNARDQIDRFLFASGGFGDGRITIDLASFSLPEKKGPNDKLKSDLPNGANRIQAGLAALNFLLNTIQNRCLIRVFENQVDFGSGTVSLNFSTFRDAEGNPCFNAETLGFMETSDANSRCNQGKIRVNELINTMMDAPKYNAAQGIAGLNRTQISAVLGVAENKVETFGNKLLVGTSLEKGSKESGVVGGDQRVLERQATLNIPGRVCYRSLDFKDVHEGGEGALARSVEERGILFSHEAEEWLCLGANGFLVTFLFNANGDLLDEAPGSIASAPGRLLSPAVRNGASCLDCHASGFLGGNPQVYDEQKNRIKVLNQPTIFQNPNGGQLTHGDFFITNQEYDSQRRQDSNLFVAAQKRSGSFLPDEKGKPIPLVPAAMEARREPVSSKVLARELGIPESTALQLLGGRTGLSRTEFENNYCQYKQAGVAGLDQSQQRVLRSGQTPGRLGNSNPTHRAGQR